jgi:hypothetical protein
LRAFADGFVAVLLPIHLLDPSDMNGRAVWLRIVEAVRELQRREAPKGAVRH